MWDDLFRAAAGENDNFEPPAVPTTETKRNPRKHDASDSSGKRPRKKKKKSRLKHSDETSQKILEKVLESRTAPIAEQIWSQLPNWLIPSSSFYDSSRCDQWEQESDCSLDAKCKKCKKTMLYHSVAIPSSIADSSAGEILAAFALVRDIRCCCSSILNEAYGRNTGSQCSKHDLQEFTMNALKKSNDLSRANLSSILTPGEADILIEKFAKVKNAAAVLREKTAYWSERKQKNKRRFVLSGIFDEIIHLIIRCDAAYFRMYYLQNSGNVPVESDEVFIPHPPTYFGSHNIAWNVWDHTTDLASALRQKYERIGDERWDVLMEELGMNQSSSELDPLSFMHKNRLSESIFMFHKSSWIKAKEAKNHYAESMKCKSKSTDRETLFYSKHETPAPVILKEWRDSCRDLLCNLYAYATISPRIIHDLKDFFRKESVGCYHVVEIGAGTGYLANLLDKADFDVKAFDVAPTKRENSHSGNDGAWNEYHGSSPPFYHVEYANSKGFRLQTEQTSLLLCYPPPLSEMAEESARSFVNQGGSIIIHIGEFSGLTGSLKFENLLGREFDLKYRTPCLNWGSDAAELTIWRKRDKHHKLFPSTLVKCSFCKRVGATLRYRLCRPLSYCNLPCFDAHKDERRVHFAFNMIPEVINEHGSGETCFVSIPCKYD
eukprot:jgi/Psemu1/293200/fgenesh1_pg.1815_\